MKQEVNMYRRTIALALGILLSLIPVLSYAENITFTGINDPALRDYLSEKITSLLGDTLSEDMEVVSVETKYLSKEYLEELRYNSEMNVFFGYTAAELSEMLSGDMVYLTIDQDGEVSAQEVQEGEKKDYLQKLIHIVSDPRSIMLISVVLKKVHTGNPIADVILSVCADTAEEYAASGDVLSSVVSGLSENISDPDVIDYLDFFEEYTSEHKGSIEIKALSGELAQE